MYMYDQRICLIVNSLSVHTYVRALIHTEPLPSLLVATNDGLTQLNLLTKQHTLLSLSGTVHHFDYLYADQVCLHACMYTCTLLLPPLPYLRLPPKRLV